MLRVRRPWRRVGWEKEVKTSLFPSKNVGGGWRGLGAGAGGGGGVGGGGRGGYPASFSVEEQATHTA